jgi:hypothetical protein
MELIKIYIEDDDSDRIQQMDKVLNESCKFQRGTLEESVLICAHCKNNIGFNIDGTKTEYAAKNDEKLIIIYSGAGDPAVSEVDIKSQRVLKIERAIPPTNGYITEEEWDEIYKNIEFDEHNKPCTFSTHTLGSSSPSECLCTLAVLCQGYLILHADHLSEEDKLSSLIQNALEIMGWTDLLNQPDINNNIDTSQKNRDKVSQQSWWKECFNQNPNRLQIGIGENSEIIGKITKEWESETFDESKLEPLIRAIYQSHTQILPPIVADAYCEIAKYLKK